MILFKDTHHFRVCISSTRVYFARLVFLLTILSRITVNLHRACSALLKQNDSKISREISPVYSLTWKLTSIVLAN